MYTVELEHLPTGTRRKWDEKAVWDEVQEYMWSEGTLSCDCNRQDYFARASGEPEPGDTGCSDTDYRIVSITSPEGSVLYCEESRP
jgi:hypothetical protein